jgi:outer membrane protein OmpA-like peptidoglycan-associated protein
MLTRGSTSTQVLVPARLVTVDSLDCDTVSITLPYARSIGALTTSGTTMLASVLPRTDRRAHLVQLRGDLTRPATIEGTAIARAPQSWTAHPTLSRDGTLLIVASDRPGGLGGLDLWYAVRRSDGSWDSLRNLGPPVNTSCDELSPFLTSDGMLLFASNGHESVGGYDLFAAPLQRTATGVSAGAPENLRPPINTEHDELFPSTPTSARRLLYWSSNRRNQNFDVYVAELRERPKAAPPAITADESKPSNARVRGRVRTARNAPVANADISVRELRQRQLVAQAQTDSSGAFEVTVPTGRELELTAQAEGGFYDVRRLQIPTGDTVLTITEDFVIPEVLTLRINFPHDQARIPYDFVLDSNGLPTDRPWTEELDRVAANILRYRDRIKRIVLVGHTDPNGSDAYNMDLGRRRVEFVIEQLRKRGVPAELMEGISAGKRNLLPRRPNEPTDQYYRRNRRVELSKVLQ